MVVKGRGITKIPRDGPVVRARSQVQKKLTFYYYDGPELVHLRSYADASDPK